MVKDLDVIDKLTISYWLLDKNTLYKIFVVYLLINQSIIIHIYT
jgi:hypothetical protein